jgi:hypothetical protein
MVLAFESTAGRGEPDEPAKRADRRLDDVGRGLRRHRASTASKAFDDAIRSISCDPLTA